MSKPDFICRRDNGDGDDPCELGTAEYMFESQKAVMFNIEGEEMWVPKSVIHNDSEIWDSTSERCGLLVVKTWWARKNELI